MPPEPMSPKPKSELRELQKRGRSLNAERAEKEANERLRQRTEADDQTLTHLQESMLQSSWEFHLSVVLGVLLVVCPGLFAMVHGSIGNPSWLAAVGLVVAVAGLFVLFRSRRWFGARAVARERDFIASLAFGVQGYEQALSRTPSDGTLTLHITFASIAPAHPEMVDLVKVLEAELFVASGLDLTVTSPRFSVDRDDAPNSNQAFYRWLRQGFKELLVLHDKHPIKTVKVIRN
jgi:hypothetical protein